MPRVLNKKVDTPTKNSIYVGRPSKWGNPFTVEKYGREEALERYRKMIEKRPDLQKKAREELIGKDLICWCSPEACHADVLLEIANGTLA